MPRNRRQTPLPPLPQPESSVPSLDELRQIVLDAVSPLASDLRDVKRDVAELKEDRVTRSDLEKTESKFATKEAVADLREEVKDIKDGAWKLLAGCGTVVTIIVLIGQHIRIQ